MFHVVSCWLLHAVLNIAGCILYILCVIITGMLNLFFLKFKLWFLKFELNLVFVYVCALDKQCWRAVHHQSIIDWCLLTIPSPPPQAGLRDSIPDKPCLSLPSSLLSANVEGYNCKLEHIVQGLDFRTSFHIPELSGVPQCFKYCCLCQAAVRI